MKSLNNGVGCVVLACALLLAAGSASAFQAGPYVFGHVGAGFGDAGPGSRMQSKVAEKGGGK